jgi:hypothetical protein
VELEDVDIENTHAAGSGGGLYLENSGTDKTTVSGLFTKTATSSDSRTGGSYGNGGGAYIAVNGKVSLNNVTIENIYTRSDYYGSYNNGGGLWLYSRTHTTGPFFTTVSGLIITNATSEGLGDGAYIKMGNGNTLQIIGTGVKINNNPSAPSGAFLPVPPRRDTLLLIRR